MLCPLTCMPSKRITSYWLEKHDKLVKDYSKNININNVFIGDSIFGSFNRPENNDIWDKHFAESSANLSLAGDKIENALWRILNGELPPSAKNIFILIGTKTSIKIAQGR